MSLPLAVSLRRLLSPHCPVCGAALAWGRSASSDAPTNFPPSRVVVVRKTTRLEYERRKNKHRLSEQELRNRLSKFGSDYDNLLQKHDQQIRSMEVITNFLESQGVDVRIRDRESYSEADVRWAEAVFSAGGDGNFLWTASKVLSPDKLVVGLNTDPETSEGYLCLKTSHYGSLHHALQEVFRDRVPRYRRARIRVEVGGALLPVRSLNEVFVGERNPSHASYYELSSNGGTCEKQKSSGLLIYTGTGSTSWAYNANKMSEEEVKRVLCLAQGAEASEATVSEELVSTVVEQYNSLNVFPGDEMCLSYVVREPIIRGIFAAAQTQGKAQSVAVRCLSWTTELVVDGQFHYELKRGGVAKCWIHPQDVLLTLHDQNVLS